MKPSHRIFFAIPFDAATKEMYDWVRNKLIEHYHGRLSAIIGTKQVGSLKSYSDIATFKAQNSDLHTQFVSQIQNADVVIADLTHNNPNVHFELGIALVKNKNILRVIGRSLTEIGFDVRNLECSPYSSGTELFDIITKYLDIFFKIKQLPISNEFPELYTSQRALKLNAAFNRGFDFRPTENSDFSLRDGAAKATFKMGDTFSEDNWFGVFFRADPVYPTFASYLAYIRQNGSVEVAIYPGSAQAPEVFERSSSPGPALSSGPETIVIEFENNYLDIQVGERRLCTQQLSFQNVGRIFFGAWQANVELISAEIICRDTINIP
jgi:hypothetical protein